MKTYVKRVGLALWVVFFSLILILVGCGGGGGGGTPPADTSYRVTGVASKGLVRSGQVSVFSIASDGTKETPALAMTSTAADGSYAVEIDYSGPVLVEVTGGTYVDEASGSETALTGVLRAALDDVSNAVEIAVSPLTELAVRRAMVSGKLLAPHIEAANALVGQLVGCDITATLPLDPQDSGAFGAGSADAQNYTLLLAALSQMARSDDFDDIDAVMAALEADLDDSVLDDTYPGLSQALDSFIAGAHNQTGAGNAAALQDLLSDAAKGLVPTGDLAEAERLLAAFLRATDADRQSAFEALDSYLDSFVPDSKEAHLFAALGTLMKVYSIDAADFIKSDLGVDFQADFETLTGEVVLDGFLRLATYDEDLGALLDGIVAQLDAAIIDLGGAEGAKAVISLTGFDTVRFDEVDIMILTTFAKLARAACLYARSVDIGITNWQVPVDGGGTVDARSLIGAETELSDTQARALLDNNSELLTYSDVTTRNDAIDAAKEVIVDYQAAITALGEMGEAGRRQRGRNAFSIDTESDYWSMKGFAEETLPSLVAALDNPDAAIVGVDTDTVCEEVMVADDGFAYEIAYNDLYKESFSPNPAIPAGHQHTLYSLLGDPAGLRNLADSLLVLEPETELYSYTGSTLYKEDVPGVEWEDPIDTYTLPETSITIDGDGTDWTSVPVFKTLGDVTLKLARNLSGDYFVQITRQGGLVAGDFSQLGVSLAMLNWDGCHGDGAYRLYLSISEWEAAPSIYINDGDDPVGTDAYQWITAGETVTGVELRSENLDQLTQQGGWNYSAIDYYKDTPGSSLNRFWEVKFLPETAN